MRPGPRCGATLGCLLLCALAIPAQELPAPEREVFQQDVQWSTLAFVHGRWPKSAIYTRSGDGSGVRKIVN